MFAGNLQAIPSRGTNLGSLVWSGQDGLNALQLLSQEFQLQMEKPASFNTCIAETLYVRRVQSSQFKKGLNDVPQATLFSILDDSHGSGPIAGRVRPSFEHGARAFWDSDPDFALLAGQRGSPVPCS